MKKWIVKISSLLFISALIIVSYAHDTMQNQSILGNGVAGQAGREEYGWIINESRHAGTSNITYKIDNISMTNADYILATYVGANRWNNTNTVTVYSSANSPNTVRAEALLNPNGTINTRTVAYFEGLTYQSNNNTNRHYASWEIVINTNNDSSFDCETEGAAVMAHEFGHAFGLVDLYLWGNRDKIMYYDVSGHAEEPHEDDKIGVKIITGQHGTGTPSPHNHNGVVQQPNYPGYHAITCTDCKAIRIDPTNSLRMLEECTFTKYYQLGDTTHGLECIDCGDKPTGLVEDHTWGQNNHFNNHSHTKQCTVCGINRLEPHNYRIKGSLHQGLYKECTDCGWIVDNVVNNDYDEVIHGDVNITTATSYSYEKILYTGNVTIHAPVSLNMSDVVVLGTLNINNGASLVINNNSTMHTSGDFLIQAKNNNGEFVATTGYVALGTGTKLTVSGDFYTQTTNSIHFSNGDPNDPAILELHGNFNQLGTNTFFNHANENGFKLVFAVNGEQRVRTDRNDVNANLGMIEVNHSELYFDTPIYQLWVAHDTIVNGNINARIIKNPNCVLEINGDFVVNQLMWIYDETIVTGMVLVQNGHLLVCNTNLTVGGDFRIQASNGQG
ncbi:MAG: hypothetical protein FWD34_09815, partial [Oscillospiraceae bacterium]|nr:hypothetical protein [Oscillospiraceae bacterium]